MNLQMHRHTSFQSILLESMYSKGYERAQQLLITLHRPSPEILPPLFSAKLILLLIAIDFEMW